MGVTVLASGGAAYVAGEVTFALTIPLIGLVCLLLGLRERRRSRVRTPERASGKSSALIAIGAVVLAFGIFADLAASANVAPKPAESGQHQSFVVDTTIQIGTCITQTAYRERSFGMRPNNDCTNPANVYELADKGGSATMCPDEKREGSRYYGYVDEFTSLCFALNLVPDHCYLVEGDRDNPSLNVDNCSNPRPGEFRVLRRIDGSSDKTQCPANTKVLSYPTPARVYCLANP